MAPKGAEVQTVLTKVIEFRFVSMIFGGGEYACETGNEIAQPKVSKTIASFEKKSQNTPKFAPTPHMEKRRVLYRFFKVHSSLGTSALKKMVSPR